jgi:L-asparaginase / beta-aspartyl-peptidase
MTVVLVHGGVSGVVKTPLPDLSSAVERGAEAPSALDAVELSVNVLEDNPALNAACGAVVNVEGAVELDAGIADGGTGRLGGVANVSVRHPISLARRVLERTPHVLITGAGAVELGGDMPQLNGPTEEQRRRWATARAAGRVGPAHYGAPDQVDTVGAVALDGRGHLAAGASTGGVFGKLVGRVGDSPIFGAGFYASRDAAVVGTGVGELFIETLAAFRTGALIERGLHPQDACEQIIAMLAARTGEAGGLLALAGDGRRGAAYNGGSWAVAGPDGPIRAAQIGAARAFGAG